MKPETGEQVDAAGPTPGEVEGVIMGVVNAFVQQSRRAPDKDVDGEPDEPDGPAKDL